MQKKNLPFFDFFTFKGDDNNSNDKQSSMPSAVPLATIEKLQGKQLKITINGNQGES